MPKPRRSYDRPTQSSTPTPLPFEKRPELLAPAGQPEAFFAAIEAGADAVYLGTQQFNARLRATNFTLDEVARLCAFAHKNARKVFITLNTLLLERELPEAVETLESLRQIGPDAFIIQDLGMYRLAKRITPEIPLHASTQMTLCSLDGALQAQRMGFERVILSRELTIEEIRAIRSSCDIELETFIHGAMCYSMSGQCLCSSYLHGKSSNRGRCLQPCRRELDVATPEGNRCMTLYSMRDMSAAPILSRLMTAGIRCFKIEGRMKPPETIAQIVRAYRTLIDAHPMVTADQVAEARRCLELAVGREPCSGYYLEQRPVSVLSADGASQSGRIVGRARAIDEGRFGMVPSEPLKAGDRLRIKIHPAQPPRAFTIRELHLEDRPVKRSKAGVYIEIVAPFNVPDGALVVKALDADAVERGAMRRYEAQWEAAVEMAHVAFPGTLHVDDNRAMSLIIQAGGAEVRINQQGSWEDDMPVDQAEGILNEFSPASGAALKISVTSELPEGAPMSPGQAQALRERALHQVAQKLKACWDRVIEDVSSPLKGKEGSPAEVKLFRVNTPKEASALRDMLDGMGRGGSSWITLPLETVNDPGFAALAADGEGERLLLAPPPFMFEEAARHVVLDHMRKALTLSVRGFVAANLGHFNLFRALGKRKFDIITAPNIGCLNTQCLAQLVELGARLAIYSLEGDAVNLGQMVEAGGANRIAVQLYGHLPIFQSRAPGPVPPGGAATLKEPRQQFRVFQRGGLTVTVPFRACDLTPVESPLREGGITAFNYDLSYEEASPTIIARELMQDGYEPAPEVSGRFNFDEGLE